MHDMQTWYPDDGFPPCGMPPSTIPPLPEPMPQPMPQPEPQPSEPQPPSFEENPNRFPIAMGYVPIQNWQQPYAIEQALTRGTIFAALDLPFMMGRCM